MIKFVIMYEDFPSVYNWANRIMTEMKVLLLPVYFLIEISETYKIYTLCHT